MEEDEWPICYQLIQFCTFYFNSSIFNLVMLYIWQSIGLIKRGFDSLIYYLTDNASRLRTELKERKD